MKDGIQASRVATGVKKLPPCYRLVGACNILFAGYELGEGFAIGVSFSFVVDARALGGG